MATSRIHRFSSSVTLKIAASAIQYVAATVEKQNASTYLTVIILLLLNHAAC